MIPPQSLPLINARHLRDLFRADRKMERTVMDYRAQVIVDRVLGARRELAKVIAANQRKQS